MPTKKKFDCICDNCGSKMENKGEAADQRFLVIECPNCGEAFLLSKAILRFKEKWEKLFSAIR
jgi:DNA-directed RNA polymerase subunit RPC12/RpoP